MNTSFLPFGICLVGLLLLGMSILMMSAFSLIVSRRRIAWMVILGFASLLALSFWPQFRAAAVVDFGTVGVFGTGYRVDAWSITFLSLFLTIGMGVAAISLSWVENQKEHAGEFLCLMILAVVAMLLSSGVADFAMLFVVLEFLTITSYILVGFLRKDPLSLEAGAKYLIVGATASAMMVYGITLVYGASGSLRFEAIDAALRGGLAGSLLMKVGLVLIIAGLGFKIAAFPFHWWAPDVYQGAPIPTVALLATGSKAAGFVLLIRVLHDAFLPMQDFWKPLIAGLAATTILFGNLAALGQTNLKRLMGYSSIGHAGFMLLGLAVGSPFGQQALIFYLYAYLFGSLLVFAAMSLRDAPGCLHDISDYAGLRDKSPWLAAALITGLVSLAGVPPLIGFFGKFLVLVAVFEARDYALAAIALAGAGVSLYYYLRVVRAVYFTRADLGPEPVLGADQKAILAALILTTIAFGIFQDPIWRQASAQWVEWMF